MAQPARVPPERNDKRILAATLCLLLAACGGGGDGADAGTAAPPGGTSGTPSAMADCGLADFQATMLQRVNQWRASGANCGTEGSFGPAAPLSWNDRLLQAATGHSEDMMANNFFSHTGSNGSTLAQRIDATGYSWSSVGENIAAGQTSINSVVDGWIASPGHCANIMNPAFQHVAVACVRGAAGNTYSTYWTMDLGRPR